MPSSMIVRTARTAWIMVTIPKAMLGGIDGKLPFYSEDVLDDWFLLD